MYMVKAVIKDGVVVNKIVADDDFRIDGYTILDITDKINIVEIGDKCMKVDGEYVFIKNDTETPEPTETELLTDYIVDIDFRVTMVELGLV